MSAEQQPQRHGVVTTIGAMVRHGWWLAALVIVLVSALALGRYIIGPQTYRAQQGFFIVVTPAGSITSYDSYQASVWEETIGHALTEHRLTTVIGGFAGAINSRLAANDIIGGPQNLTPSQFTEDLSWYNYGNHVILTAYWTTPQGATDLLNATIGALIAGDLTHLTILRGPVPANLTAQIITDGPAQGPEIDPGHAIAAQQLLALRLGLGVFAGIALLFGWEWLRLMVVSGRQQHQQSDTSTPPEQPETAQTETQTPVNANEA